MSSLSTPHAHAPFSQPPSPKLARFAVSESVDDDDDDRAREDDSWTPDGVAF